MTVGLLTLKQPAPRATMIYYQQSHLLSKPLTPPISFAPGWLDVDERKVNDERGIRCARRQGCKKGRGDDDSPRAYDEGPRVTPLPETIAAHSESPEVERALYVHALRETAEYV